MGKDRDTSAHDRRVNDAVRVYDEHADRYDAWFESAQGRPMFTEEVACLERLIGRPSGRWLEVGVGTGRFAEALGIGEGIDPSDAVLAYAARRGVRVGTGWAEDIPFSDDTFAGVLMVVTICFVADAAAAIAQCGRVLEPGGLLVVGLVPADSDLGRDYAHKGERGHLFYAPARFYTCDRVIAMAADAGLTFHDAASCLLPDQTASNPSDGIVPNAGFVAMAFQK